VASVAMPRLRKSASASSDFTNNPPLLRPNRSLARKNSIMRKSLEPKTFRLRAGYLFRPCFRRGPVKRARRRVRVTGNWGIEDYLVRPGGPKMSARNICLTSSLKMRIKSLPPKLRYHIDGDGKNRLLSLAGVKIGRAVSRSGAGFSCFLNGLER